MMVWQKVVGHINDASIRVQSKGGKTYPVETDYDADNDMVYSWAMGDLAPDVLWSDVDFDGDEPTTDQVSTGHPDGGPPRHD